MLLEHRLQCQTNSHSKMHSERGMEGLEITLRHARDWRECLSSSSSWMPNWSLMSRKEKLSPSLYSMSMHICCVVTHSSFFLSPKVALRTAPWQIPRLSYEGVEDFKLATAETYSAECLSHMHQLDLGERSKMSVH